MDEVCSPASTVASPSNAFETFAKHLSEKNGCPDVSENAPDGELQLELEKALKDLDNLRQAENELKSRLENADPDDEEVYTKLVNENRMLLNALNELRESQLIEINQQRSRNDALQADLRVKEKEFTELRESESLTSRLKADIHDEYHSLAAIKAILVRELNNFVNAEDIPENLRHSLQVVLNNLNQIKNYPLSREFLARLYEVAAMNSNFAALTVGLRKCEMRIQDLELAISEKTATECDLMAELEETCASLQDREIEYSRLVEDAGEKRDLIARKVRVAERELSALKLERDMVRAALESAIQRAADREEELTSQHRKEMMQGLSPVEVSDLRNQLASVHHQLASQTRKFQKEIECLTIQIKEGEVTANQYNELGKEQKRELASILETINSQNPSSCEWKHISNESDEELTKLKSRILALQAERNDLKNKNQILERYLTDLGSQLAAALVGADTIRACLQSDLDTRREKLNSLEERLRTDQRNFDTCESDAEMCHSCNLLRDELLILESRAKNCACCSELQLDMDCTRERLFQMSVNTAEDLQPSIEKLSAEINSRKQENQELLAKAKSQLSEAIAELKEVESELKMIDDMKNTIHKLSKKNREVYQESKQLSEEIQKIRNQINSLNCQTWPVDTSLLERLEEAKSQSTSIARLDLVSACTSAEMVSRLKKAAVFFAYQAEGYRGSVEVLRQSMANIRLKSDVLVKKQEEERKTLEDKLHALEKDLLMAKEAEVNAKAELEKERELLKVLIQEEEKLISQTRTVPNFASPKMRIVIETSEKSGVTCNKSFYGNISKTLSYGILSLILGIHLGTLSAIIYN